MSFYAFSWRRLLRVPLEGSVRDLSDFSTFWSKTSTRFLRVLRLPFFSMLRSPCFAFQLTFCIDVSGTVFEFHFRGAFDDFALHHRFGRLARSRDGLVPRFSRRGHGPVAAAPFFGQSACALQAQHRQHRRHRHRTRHGGSRVLDDVWIHSCLVRPWLRPQWVSTTPRVSPSRRLGRRHNVRGHAPVSTRSHPIPGSGQGDPGTERGRTGGDRGQDEKENERKRPSGWSVLKPMRTEGSNSTGSGWKRDPAGQPESVPFLPREDRLVGAGREGKQVHAEQLGV